MKILRPVVLVIVCLVLTAGAMSAQTTPGGSYEQIIDRMSARENTLLHSLQQYHPIVETYLQRLRPDPELITVPAGDEYFLEKLDFAAGLREQSFLARPGLLRRIKDKFSDLYTIRFLPLGFAQMVAPDFRGLDRQHYDFKFVRREFLGELRCLVIDVSPKRGSGKGRFLGRIWVEDQDYNLVRFNGTFAPAPWTGRYLHFDSWRLNLQPGLWLPAYIYTEEDRKSVV